MSFIILKLSCPDRVGLLSLLTSFIAKYNGNLTEVHQFTDEESSWFFTRITIETKTLNISLENFKSEFDSIGNEIDAKWSICREGDPKRVIVMVSKEGHCLADLLWKWHSGELNCKIVGIISNHEDFRKMVERESIPFYHTPIDPKNKKPSFEAIERIWNATDPDLIVLARFMQIIPSDICERWKGKIMNIHHSFLPSFIGRDPYKQAWERGVKLIGATCHYVTSELDDGPIVEQEVIRAEHFHTSKDLYRIGRNCEQQSLARGVRWHLADRILFHGKRTIVFRD